MAKVDWIIPIKAVRGMLDRKNGIMARMKGEDRKQEMYKKDKRDYSKRPMTEAEKASTEAFAAARAQADAIRKNPDSEEYQRWMAAFEAQKQNTSGKVYSRFDMYLIAMMRKTL